ncbi:MAG: DUF2147 domain-containing protein [Vicingaceae bacterium]|mgnify:CR=1 FL=1
MNTNKPLFFFLIFFLTFTAVKGQAKYQEKILGIYRSPNKKSKIEFVEKDGLYQGILIWNVNPNIKDKFNSNKELQTKNLVGQTIFKNLKYNKYDRSWTGKFYDTESGSTYDCNLWFEYNKNNLMARGYIDNPIIGQTKVLKRIVEE